MDSPEKPQKSILTIPVRLYIILGTSLYFLLFKMEQLIARLGNGSKLPILDTFTAEKWQVKSVQTTLAFPVVFPVIFIRNLLLLIYALIGSGIKWIVSPVRKGIARVVQATKPLAGRSAQAVQDVWEETAQPADQALPVNLPDVKNVREAAAKTGGQIRDSLGAAGKRLGNTTSKLGEGIGKIGKGAGNAVKTAQKRISTIIEARGSKTGTSTDIKEAPAPPKREVVTSPPPAPKSEPVAPPPPAPKREPVTPPKPTPKREPAAPPTSTKVDINTATLEQLTALPGIGTSLAQRILDYREAHGPFADSKALQAVSGVGANLLKKLEGQISFD